MGEEGDDKEIHLKCRTQSWGNIDSDAPYSSILMSNYQYTLHTPHSTAVTTPGSRSPSGVTTTTSSLVPSTLLLTLSMTSSEAH